jgi:hypothetical protein
MRWIFGKMCPIHLFLGTTKTRKIHARWNLSRMVLLEWREDRGFLNYVFFWPIFRDRHLERRHVIPSLLSGQALSEAKDLCSRLARS